jgi:hypothetical protein
VSAGWSRTRWRPAWMPARQRSRSRRSGPPAGGSSAAAMRCRSTATAIPRARACTRRPRRNRALCRSRAGTRS